MDRNSAANPDILLWLGSLLGACGEHGIKTTDMLRMQRFLKKAGNVKSRDIAPNAMEVETRD